MESLPLLQADFYSALIEGQLDQEEIRKYLSDYRIIFEGPWYCCLVIHTSSTQLPENMQPRLLAMSVQKQARENWKKDGGAKAFLIWGIRLCSAS